MGTGWTAPRRLISPTGATLKVYTQPAAGMPRGVVQINHGLAEHSGRYHRFAAALAASGFTVYAHDHRGHGGTTARDAQPGRFAGSGGPQKLVADIDAVRDMIAVEMPGIPVILLGHSMGGILTVSYLARWSSRLAGAAVWNANLAGAVSARAALTLLFWEKLRLGSDVPSRLMPRLTFRHWAGRIPAARTPFDWLSRDPAAVDAYIADPLCGFDPSVSLWRDLFAIIIGLTRDAAFAGVARSFPFHLVGGTGDPSTDGGRAVLAFAARLRRLDFFDVEIEIYPENRHESLNELNQDFICRKFLAWAHRVAERPDLAGDAA